MTSWHVLSFLGNFKITPKDEFCNVILLVLSFKVGVVAISGYRRNSKVKFSFLDAIGPWIYDYRLLQSSLYILPKIAFFHCLVLNKKCFIFCLYISLKFRIFAISFQQLHCSVIDWGTIKNILLSDENNARNIYNTLFVSSFIYS